jgi:LPXTG-motif cell wall-anchored protein
MNKIKLLVAFFLIVFGLTGRIFIAEFVQIPNLEIITSLSLIAGVMLGGIFTFLIPLSIIAISDIYFGNTMVLIFTWSAFVIIGIFGWLLRRRKKFNYRFIGEITGIGIASSLFFYLYTNFGWWLITDIYPHTWQGLSQCYLMGLPFLKNNLLGNLFFAPTFFGIYFFAWRYYLISKFIPKTQSLDL